MSVPTLSLDRLSVGYRTRSSRTSFELSGIDATVERGRMVCLLGPNGSGKSTLLRTVAGFQSPLAGEILFDGKPSARFTENERARFVSVVLTEHVDSGMLDARDLVSLGRYPYTAWSGGLSDSDRKVVDWALDVVDALDLAARTVMNLSDGERQKVMIARALAQEPRLIVLDEPTAFLDLPRKVEMMKLLGGLARETNCSVLLSTHEIEMARSLADRLWLIRAVDGSLDGETTGGGSAGRYNTAGLIGEGGTLSVGSPEDLALSGEFERLFVSNGVHYDRRSGTFLFGKPPERKALLRGSGASRGWTERALNRVGIEVVGSGKGGSDRDMPVVTVRTVGGGYLWTLTRSGATQGFTSIAELISVLDAENRQSSTDFRRVEPAFRSAKTQRR